MNRLLEDLKRILAELDRQDEKMAAIRIAEAIALLENHSIPADLESEKDERPS